MEAKTWVIGDFRVYVSLVNGGWIWNVRKNTYGWETFGVAESREAGIIAAWDAAEKISQGQYLDKYTVVVNGTPVTLEVSPEMYATEFIDKALETAKATYRPKHDWQLTYNSGYLFNDDYPIGLASGQLLILNLRPGTAG